MTNVIPFPREKIVRIPPAHQEDVRVTFARMVEKRLFALTEAATEGRLPGRYAYEARPSDTEETA